MEWFIYFYFEFQFWFYGLLDCLLYLSMKQAWPSHLLVNIIVFSHPKVLNRVYYCYLILFFVMVIFVCCLRVKLLVVFYDLFYLLIDKPGYFIVPALKKSCKYFKSIIYDNLVSYTSILYGMGDSTFTHLDFPPPSWLYLLDYFKFMSHT